MSEFPANYQTSAYNAMMEMNEGTATANPLASQIGGNHYKDMKIQPTEFIMANELGFCEGNVIKYVCRHGAKNGKEDLLKAKHYIDLLIAAKYPG
jgi:hypothetical protein